jgi:hypothetical protein
VGLALARLQAGVVAVHQVQRPAVRAKRCVGCLLDGGTKSGTWGLRVQNVGHKPFLLWKNIYVVFHTVSK